METRTISISVGTIIKILIIIIIVYVALLFLIPKTFMLYGLEINKKQQQLIYQVQKLLILMN